MKILLIDDDDDDIELFVEALKEIAPETKCQAERDASNALNELNGRAEQLPDVIFLDINMPVVTGGDCLDKIKANEKTKDIPVFICSTTAFEKDVSKALDSGASYFTKPVDFAELKSSLLEIISHPRETKNVW